MIVMLWVPDEGVLLFPRHCLLGGHFCEAMQGGPFDEAGTQPLVSIQGTPSTCCGRSMGKGIRDLEKEQNFKLEQSRRILQNALTKPKQLTTLGMGSSQWRRTSMGCVWETQRKLIPERLVNDI